MKKPLLVVILALLAQGLGFGQSEEKKLELWQPFLWKADDPRITNPINRFHLENPLNPINKFHLENDFNFINRYRLDNPLNPINKYRIDNLLNPVNRYDLDSPLNPINKYRSPSNPPKRGMFKQSHDWLWDDLESETEPLGNSLYDSNLGLYDLGLDGSIELDDGGLDLDSEWAE